MTRLVSISSSRADVGILQPIWRALADQPQCELHILLTGMHRAHGDEEAPETPRGVTVHWGGADLGGQKNSTEAVDAMASIARDVGVLLSDVDPDAMLVVGDRLDMLPAAVAALPFNTALVHLHGGEITEGAIDDRCRHAISKLAHLHCVSSEAARDRLIAMGEEAWRIEVTGAPGLDTLLAAPEMTASEFAAAIDVSAIDGLRLVTVHPETNAAEPLAPLDTVLAALAGHPAPTLFTAPNSDPGSANARARIDDFVATHDWARFRDTLGSALYANALRHAAMMIGNSSSGVIEASLFGLPVVNVGDRQAGRERASNVMDVKNSERALSSALDRLGATPSKFEPSSPYGDGRSGPRVAGLLCGLPARRRLMRKRVGVDSVEQQDEPAVAQC